MSWRRLAVLVRGLPPGSATFVAVNGDQFEWGAAEYLLAYAVDLLAAANWQRSGGKGRRPKPVPRPGKSRDRSVERMGAGKGLPLDELKRALENWSDEAEEGGDVGGDRAGHGLRVDRRLGEGPEPVDQP